MKVREAMTRYKDYLVVVFGRPLNEPTIPFTMLPKDRKLEDLEIAEIRVEEKPQRVVSAKLGGKTSTQQSKGIVKIYAK